MGLVTGTCFADLGNRVTALGINEERIANLKQGTLPIYDPAVMERTGFRYWGVGRGQNSK